MKRPATLLTLTILAAITPVAAHADYDTRQVWRDSEKQVVHNSWGTCVRGNWENSVDVCAPPPPAVAYMPPAPRTIIAEADRTVYFPFNVASLTPEAQQKLDSLSQRINNASDVQDAQVVGFADRIGTTSYNEKLSKKRAETVRDYLLGHNVVTEQDTMTRWVGKTESKTACGPNLSHEQLIQCLSPDRKVTVELKYKTQEVTQPQTNAAPVPVPGDSNAPTDWTGGYTTGEMTVPVPAPVPPDSYTTGEATPQAMPAPAASTSIETYPDQPAQSSQAQPDESQPAPAAQQTSARGYPVGTLGEMPASDLAQARADQDSAAQPYMGQPPLPSVAQSHSPEAQEYVAQVYKSPQPSDQDRYRYLTTGE